MNKLLLGLLLSVGVVMANETPKDDLLAMVTMGKTSGVEVEMTKSEMKDADGGYYPGFTYRKPSRYNAYHTYLRSRIYTTRMALRYLY